MTDGLVLLRAEQRLFAIFNDYFIGSSLFIETRLSLFGTQHLAPTFTLNSDCEKKNATEEEQQSYDGRESQGGAQDKGQDEDGQDNDACRHCRLPQEARESIHP